MGKGLKALFGKEHQLVSMAGQSRFLPNLVAAILIFILLWVGARMAAIAIITFPLSLFPSGNVVTEALAKALRYVFVSGTIIMAFLLWVNYMEKRPVSTMGFSSGNILRKYFLGFAAGIAFVAANTLVFVWSGNVEIDGFNFVDNGVSVVMSVIIMLGGYIVQSASEEIAVRGWLLPVIGARYNLGAGVLITSTMFGVIHLFNPNVTVVSLLNIVLAGIFMALIVIWQGDIWSVCGYHCGWNWALANVFGYPISGYTPEGGKLINLRVQGPDLMTGGYFGPEGGIIATLFLGLGIILLVRIVYKQNSDKNPTKDYTAEL